LVLFHGACDDAGRADVAANAFLKRVAKVVATLFSETLEAGDYGGIFFGDVVGFT
jgi:hypothetical protein